MFANATRMRVLPSRVLLARRVPAPLPASSLHTSSITFKEPTHSEEAVKHDDHGKSPKELQEETAKKANAQGSQEHSSPTQSEEAAKADVDGHDPLPDHKKKKSAKPE